MEAKHEMTTQATDVLCSRLSSTCLEGFRISGVFAGKLGKRSDYPFSTKPRVAPDVISSACWKGYIGHYDLDPFGQLTLQKCVALDGVEQRAEEVLAGSFWLELEGCANLERFGRIQVPFKNGRIVEDTLAWQGDLQILAWVRMSSHRDADWPALGEINWFGGLNNNTGRENNFGFITSRGGDIYFHRSQTESPPESLVGGAQVVFRRVAGKDGKLAAEKVRVLSHLSEDELTALIRAPERLTAEDTLKVALQRGWLPPREDQLLAAVVFLTTSNPTQLKPFWRKFVPDSPQDPYYSFAPHEVKGQVCKRYYSRFRQAIADLLKPLKKIATFHNAELSYSDLDELDEQLAAGWADSDLAAVQAKMLSARAAEKAVKRFYEAMNSTVEDVAISQLKGGSGEWTTHDLLVDGENAIDVKNARRTINSKDFYVEHTVPKFKLTRSGGKVKIAGVLSPYLQLEYIRKPYSAYFQIDDLTFLGETSRDTIDGLVSMFASDRFEVVRNERTVPNWVFTYPDSWYGEFIENIHKFKRECSWPEGEAWEHVFDDQEKLKAVPALFLAGKPLPKAISSSLTRQQARFYSRLLRVIGNPSSLPAIFLAVLSDFLDHLKDGDPEFSPKDYLPLLFMEAASKPEFTDKIVTYPLGTIDPLNLISSLISTLTILWRGRDEANLSRFSNFRLCGLGILQGREPNSNRWTTLVAYCGGMIYAADETGKPVVDSQGRPRQVKGKCGRTPLIIGSVSTCDECGKLICDKCQYCSDSCQKKWFRDFAMSEKIGGVSERARGSGRLAGDEVPRRSGVSADAAPWGDLPPVEAYSRD